MQVPAMPISRSFVQPVHPALVRALHGATLAVLLLAFAAVLLREGLEAKALRQTTLDLHRWLGGVYKVETEEGELDDEEIG